MSYTNFPPRRSVEARRPERAAVHPASSSRVRFEDDPVSPLDRGGPPAPSGGSAQRGSLDRSSGAQRGTSHPDIHFPVYRSDYPAGYDPATFAHRLSNEQLSRRRYPDRGFYSGDEEQSSSTVDSRRGSDDSDATLLDSDRDDARYDLSSYRHPYEIRPPNRAYTDQDPHGGGPTSQRRPAGRGERERRNYHDTNGSIDDSVSDGEGHAGLGRRDDRQRGVLANMIDLYDLDQEGDDLEGFEAFRYPGLAAAERGWQGVHHDYSEGDQMLDDDDFTIPFDHKNSLDDPEELKKNCLRDMNYKQRRKERMRMRIEFNISSILNRQMFLMRLAKALMTFGAPSHRIEAQLLSAARILQVDAEFIHIPGVILCSFGDQDTKTSETHFVKCGGRLSLGSLHEVHQIYRSVVHDEVSAKKAILQLDELLSAPPIYNLPMRMALSFFISALICPLAFGGSFVDMWIAGVGSIILCLAQLAVASRGQIYANVFEVSAVIIISFAARALSTIRSEIFCYTAISSAGVVGILPGYLILSSSLELASKNIVCGSVKMVYALIYALFLGFGLQIGSDLFLLFDPSARRELSTLATRVENVLTITGYFYPELTTPDGTPNYDAGLAGAFTFTNITSDDTQYVVNGCFRPPSFSWYLQPFPWWTQFFIVPIFSLLSSLANLQPIWTWDLVVMIVISCASYAANKIANHFIFNHSDIVSAIGAFVVGLLGNIYSRRMGGTAFTSMVTGVLFLVPSGLSQAGGINAQGNGIDIGSAMVSVTVGITVGLFTSQAIVYMFGSRKNAAVFSF